MEPPASGPHNGRLFEFGNRGQQGFIGILSLVVGGFFLASLAACLLGAACQGPWVLAAPAAAFCAWVGASALRDPFALRVRADGTLELYAIVGVTRVPVAAIESVTTGGARFEGEDARLVRLRYRRTASGRPTEVELRNFAGSVDAEAVTDALIALLRETTPGLRVDRAAW